MPESLVILAKLNRNNFAILLLFSLCACAYKKSSFSRFDYAPYNTEIYCDDGKILIRNASKKEVYDAIFKFLETKRKRGSSEKYTIIAIDNKYKTRVHLKGIPPENAITCPLYERPWYDVHGYELQ